MHGRLGRELAEHLNVSTQTISNWNAGLSEPKLSQIVETAKFLRISVKELMDILVD